MNKHFEKTKELNEDKLTDNEMDYIFGYIDFLLRKGRFDAVDALIQSLTYQVNNMELDECVTYLTTTLAAKNKLRYRKSYYDAVLHKYHKENEERPTLFKGLD